MDRRWIAPLPRRISVFLIAGLLANTCLAVNIETVPVGDAGNSADPRYGNPGFGAVNYSYRIGKYEVTAAQYTEFLNNVARVDTYGLYNEYMSNLRYGCGIARSGGGTDASPYTYSVASEFVNRPVNFVFWGDAARFANWLHNGQPAGHQDVSTTEEGAYSLNGATSNEALWAVTRNANAKWAIPSEDEWYKAAYYKGGSNNAGYWDYPTRSNTAPGRDMADPSGNNANYYTYVGPYPIDSGKCTTVVGQFKNSASPYGTFDQAGNVQEFNEAKLGYSLRGLRGGSYDGVFYGPRASDQVGSYPGYDDDSYGFRLVQIPEPGTALLLVIGFLADGLRTRRALLA